MIFISKETLINEEKIIKVVGQRTKGICIIMEMDYKISTEFGTLTDFFDFLRFVRTDPTASFEEYVMAKHSLMV